MMLAPQRQLVTLFAWLLMTASVSAQTAAAGFELPTKGQTVQMQQIEAITRHFDLPDLWAKIKKDPPINSFSSDGCSGWVEKWNGISLYQACFLHDLKYWAGYPDEEVARLQADAQLMLDVAAATGSTRMAEAMFAGVRTGGGERFNLPFSWGFGRRER